MKRIGKLTAILAAALSVSLAACQKDSDQQDTPTPEPQPDEAMGTYTFGDKEYEIRFATAYDDGQSYSFLFSPLDARPLTTYLGVSLLKYFAGRQVDVESIYHNDDYSFIYEDPLHYYSRLRALKSGTLYISDDGDNCYTVGIDVCLADGTPVKMEFSGEIAPELE